jgi:KUP system potassium uptake protein
MFCWKLNITDKQFMQYYSARLIMRSEPTSFRSVKEAFHDFDKVGPIGIEDVERMNEELEPTSSELLCEGEEDPLTSVYGGGVQPAAQPVVRRSTRKRLQLKTVPKRRGVITLRRRRTEPSVSQEIRSPSSVEEAPRPGVDHEPSRTRGGNIYKNVNLLREAETYEDYVDAYGAYVFNSRALAIKDTPGKALKGPLREQWIKAIRAEVLGLVENGTLELTRADLIVPGSKVIHSTLQLKHKKLQDATTDKFKARLCACGNELYGLVAETFSPTIGVLAYATVHQISVIDNMFKQTVDTVGAYLHQEYPQDITPLYVTIDDKIAEVCGLPPGGRYRVKKYLYGLPDAGVAYYKAYSTHLIATGYQRSMSDPCLYIRREGTIRTYVWTHVDDTFVCSTDESELERFSTKLREKFEITVVKDVKEYLGVAITKQPNGDVLLTQPKLLNSLLEEYKEELSAVKMKGVPVPLRVYDGSYVASTPEMNVTSYLHLLGALIYLCKSRPDISTAVSFAATFAAKPTVGAFKELLLVLKYLECTRDKGLLLKTGSPGSDLRLTCHVDASYLTHRDSKSHTGYTMSFGKVGTFYSKSGKQSLVTTSSTHAELRAVYSLIVDLIFVVNLCIELGRPVKLPCIVMEDNSAVIQVTTSPEARAKQCKHFLMLVNFVREQVIAGLIQFQKVVTKLNIADVLTKIVTGNEYSTKADLLLGRTSL